MFVNSGKFLVIGLVLLSLPACGGRSRFKGDSNYDPVESSRDPAPEWAESSDDFKAEMRKEGLRIFIAEGKSTDREEACASARDAAQLEALREIQSSAEQTRRGGKEFALEGDVKVGKGGKNVETTGSDVKGQISGLEQAGVFWQKRDYSKVGGRSGIYLCLVQLRIASKEFDKLKPTATIAPASGN